MLLYDASHTSHTRAQTGIQRVTRCLFQELAAQGPALAICHDPYQDVWRALQPAERQHLHPVQPGASSRKSLWSWRQRWGGHARRLIGRTAAPLPAATGLICPEFFSARTGGALPALLPRVAGPRVALFYDAIPLQYPELTPPGTVARFPGYLRELLAFDGIAAISETSAQLLRDYWRWLDVPAPPPVLALPLAIVQPPLAPRLSPLASTQPPRLLCVCTVEGRKNHLALLDACAALWSEGLRFELQLIGLARPDTAGPALAKIQSLQAAGHPLLYNGPAPDEALRAAYETCAFTVYPSIIEGFGLPVLESLSYGKPCICSAQGALGESARGGGCLALDTVDAAALAAAIRQLLQSPATLASLTAAARARPFKSWPDYARELTAWMATLPRRA